MIKRLVLVSALIYVVLGVALTTFSLSLSTRTIRTPADYRFAIRIITNIPSGGFIRIIFPSIYTNLPSGTNPCSITGVSAASSVRCSFTNRILTISNCFPNSGTTITFTINQISNPLSAASSSSFIIYTLSASGGILDDISKDLIMTYDHISLLSGSIISESQISGAMSRWTLNLNTNFQVSSEINVKLPY